MVWRRFDQSWEYLGICLQSRQIHRFPRFDLRLDIQKSGLMSLLFVRLAWYWWRGFLVFPSGRGKSDLGQEAGAVEMFRKLKG